MENKTEHEVLFDQHELIVSMTDTKGNIVYVNDIFCKVAEFERDELIGENHNIVRHPSMPKAIFKKLWDTILAGKPVSAFVKNKTKNGNYYWVKAYVAPVFEGGEIVRLTSYRRPINDFVKREISKVYDMLLEYEKSHTVEQSLAHLVDFLGERHLSYDQFIDRLSLEKSISSAEALGIDMDGYYVDHVIFKTSIVRSVSLGQKDVTVVEPCCCNFGKKLKSLELMPFTSHPSWGKMHFYHNHVHALMKEYVGRADNGASESELESILRDVERDTENLLGMLRNVVDNYVEERVM